MYKTAAGTSLVSSGTLAFTGFNTVLCLVAAGALIVLGTLLARLRIVGPVPRRRGSHKPLNSYKPQGRHQPQLPQKPTL
jgi:hypothetical protein